MASTPHVHLATDDLAICHWDNLVMLVWVKHTRLPHLAEIRIAVQMARRANDNPLCLLQVVLPTAAIPDSSARRALSDMLRSFEGLVSHCALVHLGSGFSASVARSVVTAITALRSHGFPFQVFGGLHAALTWLGQNNGAVHTVSAYRIAQQFLDAAIGGNLRA
jgi:hypothetical protein